MLWMASIVIGRIFKREVYIDTCLYIMKERIRQIMDQAKLSQQDFAAKLGISPASLSSIFTGRTNPTNNHVMAVHRAFPDININWLMFGEGDAHVSMNILLLLICYITLQYGLKNTEIISIHILDFQLIIL